MLETLTMLGQLAAVVPNPTPEQPPGTEGITTLLNWISWIVIALGVAGFMASAGFLVWAGLTGREMQGFKGLGLAILACILAVGAGAIMQVFV